MGGSARRGADGGPPRLRSHSPPLPASREDAEDALRRAIEILLAEAGPRAGGARGVDAGRHPARGPGAAAARPDRARAATRGSPLEPDGLAAPDPGPEQGLERRERMAAAAALFAS